MRLCINLSKKLNTQFIFFVRAAPTGQNLNSTFKWSTSYQTNVLNSSRFMLRMYDMIQIQVLDIRQKLLSLCYSMPARRNNFYINICESEFSLAKCIFIWFRIGHAGLKEVSCKSARQERTLGEKIKKKKKSILRLHLLDSAKWIHWMALTQEQGVRYGKNARK